MSNSGVFDVNDIRYLMDYQQWSGVGTLELIETQSASSSAGVAAIDFLNIKEDEYNVHFMTMNNMQSVTDNKETMQIQLYESGTLETANVYEYARQNGSAPGTFAESYTTTDGDFALSGGSGNQSNEKQYSYVYFYALGNPLKWINCSWMSGMWSSDPYFYMSFGAGTVAQTSVVDGIRIKTNGGNYESFDISLYGIRYS